MKIEASSPDELLEILRGIDVSVPRRTEGRKTEHTERYAICHLLSTLATTDRLNYPLSLSHADRPDFILSLPEKVIGIEHTEAVPENEAAKQALREKGVGPKVHFTNVAVPGEKRRKSKQLRAEIEADESGDGWVGDQPEREWARAIVYFITQKENKLKVPGFTRHDEDWLLVYESWSLPAIDLDSAAAHLIEHLREDNSESEFQRIFILAGNQVCEIAGGIFVLHPGNDLWQ